jgi:sterol desaturase/sphingolipid hydroxylase (fatty acid hydroxylase superfamily)
MVRASERRMHTILSFVIAFGVALVVGTFVEYWGHRLMHSGWLFRRRHGQHHAHHNGQGVLGEFRDYFTPTLLIIGGGFLVSRPAGFGFAAGDLVYALAAAYAHQVQHERPELCFWMPRPVHRMHHDYAMSRHDFGILFDGWDRVFGTYRPIGAARTLSERPPIGAWFAIHWWSASEPVDRLPRAALHAASDPSGSAS